MRSSLAVVALLSLLSSSSPASSLPPPASSPSSGSPASARYAKDARIVAGRLIVKPPVDVVDDDARRAWLDGLGRALGAKLTLRRALVLGWLHVDVALPAGRRGRAAEDATLSLVQRAQKVDGVRGAAAEWIFRPLTTPNDPLFQYMWNLDAIGMRQAWDITTGRSVNRVGVVDTGTAFSHEDLLGKRGAEFDFVSDDDGGFRDGDGNIGRDGDATDPGDGADCNDGRGPQPSSFHGTHVAGTILANGNNGVGVAGINWGAKVVTARALGRCGGSSVDINEAVAWMGGFQIDDAPSLSFSERPRVINLSLGSTGAICAAAGTSSPDGRPIDSFTFDVFRAVAGQGALLVVAAGNDSRDGNIAPVASPANCDVSIAVGAFGPDGRGGIRLAGYSNFGPEIAIVAPGGTQAETNVFTNGVLSTVDASVSPFEDGSPYTAYDGTSMAAPHVAGVLSLMLDVNPSLSRDAAVAILQRSSGTCSGCQGKPALRADLAIADAAGTEVTTQPGDACAGTGFCSDGQRCVEVSNAPTCLATCTAGDDCANDETCTALSGGGGSVCAPGGGGGGGGGGGTVDDECDPRRGHMDCAVGTGCVENDSGHFVCEAGVDGDTGVGGLCDGNDGCSTGLCDRGVCTLPCDDEPCRDGYTCDVDVDVPGGLCRADSCADDPGICGDGFDCSYSAASRYVCSVGPSNYRGTCGAAPGASGAVGALAALLLVVRRRRRQR